MKTKKMLFVLFVALVFSCTEKGKNHKIQTVTEQRGPIDEEMIFEEKLEIIVEQKGANLTTKSETNEALETIYESKSNANDEIILEELETIVEQN